MGDIRNVPSNDVRYVLKSDVLLKSLYLDSEPIGWKDDDFKLDRHKDYHGIFYNYTGSLSFTDDALDYIENSYKLGGINTNLYIRKEVLREVNGDVKWVFRYRAKGDFSTKEIKDQQLTLNFNSLELAELIKSHESDEFEIDLEESIDGANIGELKTNSVTLEGRDLFLSGELSDFSDSDQWGYNFDKTPIVQITLLSQKISSSINVFTDTTKWSMILDSSYNRIGEYINASSLMLQREQTQVPNREIELRFNLDFLARSYSEVVGDGYPFTLVLVKYTYDEPTATYIRENEVPEERIIFRTESSPTAEQNSVVKIITVDKNWNDGYAFMAYGDYLFLKFNRFNIIASEKSFFERSVDMKFVFTHDLINRLMHIITGKNDVFYSKLLGRKELLDNNGNEIYKENGDFGLIGNISGWWARGFVKGSEKYKSLTISLKDTLDSLKAIGNTGIGIETINFKERLRLEELGYFYQNETVVKFPNQVTNVSRKVDASLFFSGLTLGYQYGGDYENELGLDEPNTTAEFVTPIRKSSNKYVRTSKIRSDDYGLEITRRKPQSDFPTEDTKRDDSIWWLDLKKENEDDLSYTQKRWWDRLTKAPTGIFSPDTFFGMFFTPRVLMKRHSWVFTSGMMPYLIKKIRHISSKANDTLTMLIKNEDKELSESSNVYVRDLSRPKLLPEIITCSHNIDYDLMDWITGTTRIKIGNSYEDVPNYYFKMQIINEYGDKEKVYLLNCDPTGNGSLTFQKAYDGSSDGTASVNTIIGGVSTEINSAGQVAAKIGVLESDIFNFKVVGDDVHFYIIKKYTLGSDAFKLNSNITSYIDLDSKMEEVGHGAFLWANSIKEVQLNGVIEINSSSFQANGLLHISLPNCTTHNATSSTGAFYYNRWLKTADLPVITNLVPNTFSRCFNIELINIPLCVDLGDPAVMTNVFYLANKDCVINIHNSMATINNGEPDADLVYAQNIGMTINYI